MQYRAGIYVPGHKWTTYIDGTNITCILGTFGKISVFFANIPLRFTSSMIAINISRLFRLSDNTVVNIQLVWRFHTKTSYDCISCMK